MNYQITIDGEISSWGYSKGYMRNELAKYKGKHVDLRISSLGGDLNHALDIRQQLIDHGDVTAYLTGFVASAATVIATGAKETYMSKYAMYLVHKCSNFVDTFGFFNADEMQDLIEQLQQNKLENDKIDMVLANLYVDKCKKKNAEEILDILKKAEWLNAQEALEMGFIDGISEADDEKVNFTPALREKFNAFNLPLQGIERTESPVENQSILAKMFEMLRSLVSAKQEPSPEVTNEISNEMTENLQFAAIMNVLGVESLQASADGSITLNAEQMQSINDRINTLISDVDTTASENAAFINEIVELKEQVKNLQKMPGDTTAELHEDNEGASEEIIQNIIKKFL